MKNTADLGHALVIFDLIGQTLLQPRVTAVQFWGTRWIPNDDPRKPPMVYDALRPDNSPTPIGQALGMWGRHLGGQLLAATAASTSPLRVYASTSAADDRIVVLLLNKGPDALTVRVEWKGVAAPQLHAVEVLRGRDPAALEATLTASTPFRDLPHLPGYSITAATFLADKPGPDRSRLETPSISP